MPTRQPCVRNSSISLAAGRIASTRCSQRSRCPSITVKPIRITSGSLMSKRFKGLPVRWQTGRLWMQPSCQIQDTAWTFTTLAVLYNYSISGLQCSVPVRGWFEGRPTRDFFQHEVHLPRLKRPLLRSVKVFCSFIAAQSLERLRQSILKRGARNSPHLEFVFCPIKHQGFFRQVHHF